MCGCSATFYCQSPSHLRERKLHPGTPVGPGANWPSHTLLDLLCFPKFDSSSTPSPGPSHKSQR